jgi:hypothetical protein
MSTGASFVSWPFVISSAAQACISNSLGKRYPRRTSDETPTFSIESTCGLAESVNGGFAAVAHLSFNPKMRQLCQYTTADLSLGSRDATQSLPLHHVSPTGTLILQGFVRPQGDSMQLLKLGSIVLASSLAISMSAGISFAQDGAKQDMKSAGTDTKDAAKDAGHGVDTGTKKAYHKTASGTRTATHKTTRTTKRVYHKTAEGTKTAGRDIGHGTKVVAKDTAHGTEKVGDKIAGKPTPQ